MGNVTLMAGSRSFCRLNRREFLGVCAVSMIMIEVGDSLQGDASDDKSRYVCEKTVRAKVCWSSSKGFRT